MTTASPRSSPATRQQGGGWLSRWKANPVERLIMESDGIDVRIFPTEAAVQ